MAETSVMAVPARARSARGGRRLLSIVATTALALGSVALPVVAQAAESPSFTTDVTEVANDRIDIAIEGTGYGDVVALPGQAEPHAYFTLVEKDAVLSDVTDTQSAISATIDADGHVSGVLPIPSDELDQTKSYEVISWPSRSFPTDASLYARADITIDWDALFPAEEPTWDPQLTVTPSTDLDPAGDTVTVAGTGYNPAQGIYVFLCSDVELPADLWQLAMGCRTGAKSFTPGEDGTFEIEFSVTQLNDAPTAVYTAANHTAQTDRTQDAKASLAFAEPQPQPAVPTFTTDVTEVANDRIDIAIEGTGYGDIQVLPGQTEPHAYFTLVEKDADLSNVGQTDAAASATIDADGNVSVVLPIPSDELDQTKSYEVISWPSRSFPTDANLYARADITIDWDALFPAEEQEPTEPVFTLTGPDGDELTSVTQGDEATFSLSPVETGTEFEVTIQSDPITLPELAVADADGTASATWVVPSDFETGEHTVTFASGVGSYSATFEVLGADAEDGGSGDDDNGLGAGSGSNGSNTAAGTTGSANGQLAVTGTDGAGIALSTAALLMLLGAGVLIMARRRALATDQV